MGVRGAVTKQCQSCRSEIRWVLSANGKPMPIDAVPSPRGNLRVRDQLSEDGHAVVDVVSGAAREALRARGQAYLSHHATCPHGRQWQRRREARRAV